MATGTVPHNGDSRHAHHGGTSATRAAHQAESEADLELFEHARTSDSTSCQTAHKSGISRSQRHFFIPRLPAETARFVALSNGFVTCPLPDWRY